MKMVTGLLCGRAVAAFATLWGRARAGVVAAMFVAIGLAGPVATGPAATIAVGAPQIAAASVAAAAMFSLAAAPAQAQTADVFGKAEAKASETIRFLFKMLRYLALAGIVGVIGLGFFGNLNWSWVAYIALGCLVVAVAPGFIDWLADNQFSNANL